MSASPTDHVVGPFLRATVLAEGRAVDVVLPTDRPVAALVPVVLELLGHPDDGTLRHVATLDGRVLAAARPLGEAGLRDGVQLRVVAAAEAPSDPVVYDLVDAVEEERPAGAWDATNRVWGLALVAALLLGTAAAVAASAGGVDRAAVFATVGMLALAASLAAARWSTRAAAWVGFGAAWAAFAVAAVLTTLAEGAWPVGWLVLALPLVGLSAAWCLDEPRAGLASLAAWLLFVVSGGVTWVVTGDVGSTAAVVAVAATAVLGLLPRLALATTGAFAVDTDLGRGLDLRSRRVVRAVTAAHLSLAGAVVLTAATGGAALCTAALSAPADPWVLALVGSQGVAWLVRTRHFPLVLERVVVLAAGLLGLGGLAAVGVERWSVGAVPVVVVLVAGAVVALGMVARPPGALAAATGRRWAARVETVAVLAGLPLLVGAFGAYADLLTTF
ncbi:EsaB/YukD family protein [Phycicoccus avicenniae]|uniref:EsaB/YukD family protein n=1 Tax=Phycicoccus avicenniae TaxID=2828860 RepID=UPI003D2CE3A2